MGWPLEYILVESVAVEVAGIPGQAVDGSAAGHAVAKYAPDEDIWHGADLYYFEKLPFPVETESLL